MPCWSETPQGIQIVSVNSQIKKKKTTKIQQALDSIDFKCVQES